MADKKITALTELTSTGKAAADLLHIIDFSSSPVNKKITLANLFARIDTPVSSVGTSNFEFGPTTAISAFKVDIPNATPASGAEHQWHPSRTASPLQTSRPAAPCARTPPRRL